MKKLFVILLSLSLLTACVQKPDGGTVSTEETSEASVETTEETTEETNPSPTLRDIYDDYCDSLSAAKTLRLDIQLEKSTTVKGQSFVASITKDTVFTKRGTEDFSAKSEEKHRIGAGGYKYKKYCVGGKLYSVMDDGTIFNARYSCVLSEEEFLAEVPIVVMDSSLYGGVGEKEHKRGRELCFFNAISAESWALPSGAVFKSASGSAVINAEGEITESHYTLNYTIGESEVTADYTVKPYISPRWTGITAPEGDFTPVFSVDATELFNHAPLYMLCSTSVASKIKRELHYFDTASVSTTAEGEFCKIDGEARAHFEGYSTHAYNYELESVSFEENYKDSVYTCSYSDGSTVTEDYSDDRMISIFCENMYGFMSYARFCDSFSSMYTDKDCVISFTVSEEMLDMLVAFVSANYFGDKDALDEYGTDYKFKKCEGTMTVDATTGLPTSFEMEFSCLHTLDDGYSYILSFSEELTLDMASESAKKLFD